MYIGIIYTYGPAHKTISEKLKNIFNIETAGFFFTVWPFLVF